MSMTVAAMAYLWGQANPTPARGISPRPRPWDRSVTGTPPRKNDETPGRDGATARDPRGRPERCEATTSAACAPSGPSPRRGRRRATGPTPPVWTAKFTPSTRFPHTGRHGVGVVVVVVGRLGRRRGRRSDGVEPLEGRARVPEPELDAGGLERRQRRARALGAPAVVVAKGSAAVAWAWSRTVRRGESSRVAALRRVRETPPPCNEETVAGPSTPSTRLEDVQGRRLRTVDQQTTPRRRSARRRAPPA